MDAIAFDPNLLTGGKFVIQAKRYTRTLDVSAVRDLFGTLQNEGANRRPRGRTLTTLPPVNPIALIAVASADLM